MRRETSCGASTNKVGGAKPLPYTLAGPEPESEDMPKIIVDSRESRSGLAKELEALGAEIVSEELEVGDYILCSGLAVERKAATDFVLSILDRRIFEQVELLKVTYERPFVVVEGDIYSTRSNIEPNALMGAISWISVIKGIPILETRNTRQTAQLLWTMCRHAVDGLGYEVALRGAKPKDRTTQAQFVVEGLPSVGPSAAKKLLAHFGSAHAVLSATKEDLRKVAGVGQKTAEVIREVLEYDTRTGEVG
jgi:ERCC4-type nuclease